MSPIKTGLVGYGSSARFFHLPYIAPNPDLEMYAFLQRAPAPERNFAAIAVAKSGTHCTVDYPNARHYRTAEDFFADELIELVIVCTHHDTHAHFAELALKAGKHVVVEKPFTRTSEEADRLISLAEGSNKILTVFQNRRWDGDFQTLKALLRDGVLGEVTEAEIHYDIESPAWLRHLSTKEYVPGLGLMFGLGTHSIDQALVLFGKPKSVTAFLRTLRGIESENEDTFTIMLQYETPLLVTIKTTVVTVLQEQLKYFVRGRAGTFIKHGTDVQEEQVFRGMKATEPGFGVEDERLYGTLTTYRPYGNGSSYDLEKQKYVSRVPTVTGYIRGYYENIVGAIRGTAELEVKPMQSRDGIRLIELARRSHETGTSVAWS